MEEKIQVSLIKVCESHSFLGGPVRTEQTRKRTFRTKQETKKSKNITSTLVGTLLLISVVVPMLQYYGYTSKE